MSQILFPRDRDNLASSLHAGQVFEATVAFNLMREFTKIDIFSNLSVPLIDSFTSIDLIVLIGNVCIVAEMKNYSKNLEGNVTSFYWFGRNNKREFKINNPLRQNYFHCVSLTSALMRNSIDISHIEFMDFIVVPNSCELKVPSYVLGHVVTEMDFEGIVSRYHSKLDISVDKRNLELRKMMNKWRNMAK